MRLAVWLDALVLADSSGARYIGTCMYLNTTSAHAADIHARDKERAELARYVDSFLEGNEITVLETRTTPRPDRPTYNSAISVSPAKAKQVGVAREEAAALVRELSTIEIEGVTIRRSATEVAKAMRQRGYKMRAPSVRRIAESIGITLIV